jgi:hypothetical protein
MKENKKGLIIGAVVGLCLVVVIILMFKTRKYEEPTMPIVSEEKAEVLPEKVVAPVKKPVAKVPYNVAVVEYTKTGRRIQFNETCQAVPFLSTFANGTTIMIDNRSSKDRAIKIGTTTYNVGAYSYELAKLSVTKSPTTYYVDCDSQQNPATIIVQ